MKIVATVEDDIESMILAVQAARSKMEHYQDQLSRQQKVLTDYMEANQRKTLRVSDGEGFVVQATYKQQTSVKIDEDGLRKKMGAPNFDKYTVKKLDRKKLEAALDDSEALRLVVAPYVTVSKSAPFIQMTVKEDKAEDA